MSNAIDIQMTDKDFEIFILQQIEKRKEEKEKLSLFIKSSLFNKIVSTIIKKNIFLDEEHFRYFPEKVISEFNIPELNEENLNLFISCMIDDELVIPQNSFIEEETLFENTTTEKLGLRVFMMWGQGCCIQIFPASINRRGNS